MTYIEPLPDDPPFIQDILLRVNDPANAPSDTYNPIELTPRFVEVWRILLRESCWSEDIKTYTIMLSHLAIEKDREFAAIVLLEDITVPTACQLYCFWYDLEREY